MTKLNYNTKSALQGAIHAAAVLLINAEPCRVLATQILDLALTEENKFVLSKAAKIVDAPLATFVFIRVGLDDLLPPGVTFSEHKDHLLGLSFDEPQAIMLPAKLTPRSNSELLAQPGLRDWLRWRLKVGVALGALNSLIERAYLDNITLEQLRYLVPGTVMLAKRTPGLEKYVDRLQEFKAPSVLPKMTPALRSVLAEAAELLGIVSLMDPDKLAPKTSVNFTGDVGIEHPMVGRVTLI